MGIAALTRDGVCFMLQMQMTVSPSAPYVGRRRGCGVENCGAGPCAGRVTQCTHTGTSTHG